MPVWVIRVIIIFLLFSLGKLLSILTTPAQISFPPGDLWLLCIAPHRPPIFPWPNAAHLTLLCITSEPGVCSGLCMGTHNSAFINHFFNFLSLRSLTVLVRDTSLCVSICQASSRVPSIQQAPTLDSWPNGWILKIELNSMRSLGQSQKKHINAWFFQIKCERMIML